MNIGIIGAGNIGGALAKKFVALGHEVKLANSRGPDTLEELAAETGGQVSEGATLVRIERSAES